MAQALRPVENDTPQTALVAQVSANPAMVLLDRERFDQFYEAIKAETDKLIPDLTTEKGRKEIASMAFKVAKTKTAIDAAGKLLNEEARAKINLVDAARRDIRDKLDALKDEVRRPLTEWEAREEERIAACEALIESMKAAAVVSMDDTAETVGQRLAKVSAYALDEGQFQSALPAALAQQEASVQTLTAAHARLVKEEADRAELERLRAEAAERAERERQEAEAKAAAEAAERARQEAQARAARAAEEEQARIAAAAKAAEDAARAAAEARANEERLAQQRAHDEALAAEKRRADEAEAAREAEARRVALAEAQAAAAAEAQRKADEARAADLEHRSKIMGAAKQAIMGHGVGEQTARAIVLAIAAGDVPNVSIRF
ncbi:MAG: hypothetical protein VX755_12385 [Pseudomonadota bacterium]|nr:hypothetical protein [Pseudomonadota bacterium]MED5538674.1 hypothetical protein [Pseudomonadota bacterium]